MASPLIEQVHRCDVRVEDESEYDVPARSPACRARVCSLRRGLHTAWLPSCGQLVLTFSRTVWRLYGGAKGLVVWYYTCSQLVLTFSRTVCNKNKYGLSIYAATSRFVVLYTGKSKTRIVVA